MVTLNELAHVTGAARQNILSGARCLHTLLKECPEALALLESKATELYGEDMFDPQGTLIRMQDSVTHISTCISEAQEELPN